MREGCPVAACHHGGYPTSLDREIAPTDGVNAAVDGMKPTARHPPPHRAPAKPKSDQLPKSDHAMLLGRDGNDPPIDLAAFRSVSPRLIVDFRPTMGRFSTIAGHGAMVCAPAARVVRGLRRKSRRR
jgi:hypothetical protein